MAREIGDIAYANNIEPIYVTISDEEIKNWEYSDEIILERDVCRYTDMKYIIGIGNNAARSRLAKLYRRRLAFTNLFHPTTSFGNKQRDVLMSRQGLVLAAGVRFTSDITVGDFCIFNLNVTINHNVNIGSFVYFAPGAHIAGNIVIGSNCWIGMGAVINQGMNDQKRLLHDGVTIGSGAVVTDDCDARSVYVGVPARKIK